MDKKETRLFNVFDRCRTRKCSKYLKKRKTATKRFNKEEAKKCQQKSSRAFSKCSDKLYKGSKLEKISKESVQCSDNKCSAQKLKLNNYRKTLYK